ncbi:substrate-binding domain-containing protein [Bifidobacterium simiarum]|nr:substrate-binding domain-containing protein [Bifidobacterium simiarum]
MMRHGAGRRFGRSVAAVLLTAGMIMPLAGCVPQGRAVGDTQDSADAVAHDGVDRHDLYVGVVGGSKPGDDDVNRRLVEAMDQGDLNPVFLASNGDAGGQQKAVADLLERNVKVIVIVADRATGWEEALGEARQAGIPVVLADSTITPDDQTLYAARFHLLTDGLAGNASGNAADKAEGETYYIADALANIVDDVPHGKVMNVRLVPQWS